MALKCFSLYSIINSLIRFCLLDLVLQTPHPPCQSSKPKCPPLDTGCVDEEVYEEAVEYNIHNHVPKTGPLVAGMYVQGLHVLRAIVVRAVSAVRRRIRVLEISCLGDVFDERACILCATKARRRVEMRKLGFTAFH